MVAEQPMCRRYNVWRIKQADGEFTVSYQDEEHGVERYLSQQKGPLIIFEDGAVPTVRSRAPE